MLLAGWLFADLALALVVILLATSTDFPAVAVEPSPSPTPSPTPSPEAVTEVGVELKPVQLRVRTDATALLSGRRSERRRVADAIRDKFRPHQRDGRRAAFVLTFGASPSSGEGVAVAEAANEILRDALPAFMDRAATRDFWQSTRTGEFRRGELLFEVYLFITG